MKINQKVKTKTKNRFGIVIEITEHKTFENEIIVLLESGKKMLFFESELETVNV